MDNSVLKLWHQIVETRDLNRLYTLLDDEVVFHSPVVHTPQVGKSITMKYLGAAFNVFFDDTFTYIREVEGKRDAVLEFTVKIEDIGINGVDMIQWNEEGKITEFKVMIRPLKAIQLIHRNMAAMLEKSNKI